MPYKIKFVNVCFFFSDVESEYVLILKEEWNLCNSVTLSAFCSLVHNYRQMRGRKFMNIFTKRDEASVNDSCKGLSDIIRLLLFVIENQTKFSSFFDVLFSEMTCHCFCPISIIIQISIGQFSVSMKCSLLLSSSLINVEVCRASELVPRRTGRNPE